MVDLIVGHIVMVYPWDWTYLEERERAQNKGKRVQGFNWYHVTRTSRENIRSEKQMAIKNWYPQSGSYQYD